MKPRIPLARLADPTPLPGEYDPRPVRDWTWERVESEPTCSAQPSPRSTARCEMPVNHHGVKLIAGSHAGRTRGGYWKFWPVTP